MVFRMVGLVPSSAHHSLCILAILTVFQFHLKIWMYFDMGSHPQGIPVMKGYLVNHSNDKITITGRVGTFLGAALSICSCRYEYVYIDN